jgi:hypothetical protein
MERIVMTIPRKWLVLVMLCGAAVLGSSCAVNLRDAVVSGALDFVSGSTSNLLSSLLSLTPA